MMYGYVGLGQLETIAWPLWKIIFGHFIAYLGDGAYSLEVSYTLSCFHSLRIFFLRDDSLLICELSMSKARIFLIKRI